MTETGPADTRTADPKPADTKTADDAACGLLLVEDDEQIGEMLTRGLAGAGYRVDWVRSLAAAVEEARSRDHRLVVLDRMLPDGDGAALCAALRKSGHGAAICMLTARDTLEDKLAGFDAGAEDYLTKPFEFEELLARLAVLRRRAETKKPAIRLDEARRALFVGVEPIPLTRREWPLMRRLIEHQDRIVSRDELIEAAWGDEGEVTENSVDVYVGYLRRKLAKAGGAVRIETIRGEGFRLVV